MEINNIFKNEAEEIKAKIANLPVENCINNYFTYCEQKNKATGLEKQYIKKLDMHMSDFLIGIERRKLENATLEDMKTMYLDVIKWGFYGINDKPYDELTEDYEYSLGDKGMYNDIKNEMTHIFVELLEEMAESKKNKELKDKKSKLEYYQRELDFIDKQTAERKEKLKRDIERTKNEINALINK